MRTIKVTNCMDSCPFYCGDADGQCTASDESRAWFSDKGTPPTCPLRKEAVTVELDE